jgi:hypothetical protein
MNAWGKVLRANAPRRVARTSKTRSRIYRGDDRVIQKSTHLNPAPASNIDDRFAVSTNGHMEATGPHPALVANLDTSMDG